MKHIVVAIVTLALGAVVGAQPAPKPDFSGNWTMNVARSDFGALPAPAFITRAVTHAEPQLSIIEEQPSPVGDQKVTRKYVTDGSETTFDANGAPIKGSAQWDGATLVVITKVDAIGLAYNDKMTLSADGKTMTSRVHISTPQGDVDLTVVFDKQ